MVKHRNWRKMVLIGMAIFMLALSLFAGLEHHSCSDAHCPICALLGLKSGWAFLPGACLVLLIYIFAHLFCKEAETAQTKISSTLVAEKVKITC